MLLSQSQHVLGARHAPRQRSCVPKVLHAPNHTVSAKKPLRRVALARVAMQAEAAAAAVGSNSTGHGHPAAAADPLTAVRCAKSLLTDVMVLLVGSTLLQPVTWCHVHNSSTPTWSTLLSWLWLLQPLWPSPHGSCGCSWRRTTGPHDGTCSSESPQGEDSPPSLFHPKAY